MDDDKIVRHYMSRQESAIAETATKYGALCYSVAYGILGSREDAEECVNDTYLRAWNSIPPEEPDHLGAFLSKIVRNLAVDRHRRNTAEKRSGTVSAAFDELAAVIPDGNSELMTDRLALKTAMNRFITSLSPRNRMIFMRRYFYMDSTKDIARMLTTTDTSVRVTLSALRRKLRKFLSEEGIEK